MKHTPGPWTVEEFNADDLQSPARFNGPVVVYADADCDIHPVADCSCNHTCRESDEAQANARLIAAAPDLLEACKKTLGYLTTRGAVPDLERLRQAIAKAEPPSQGTDSK